MNEETIPTERVKEFMESMMRVSIDNIQLPSDMLLERLWVINTLASALGIKLDK